MGRLRPSQSMVLALACFGMALGSFTVVAPAVCVAAVARDLQMALEAHKGLFLAASYWGLLVVMPLSGWVVRRIGVRLLVLVSALLSACGLFGVTVAPTGGGAVIAMFCAGLGRGLYPATATALLCELYPRERIRVSNFFHSFFHIGMVTTTLALMLWLRWGGEWRLIFRTLALIQGGYAVLAGAVHWPDFASPAVSTAGAPLSRIVRQPVFLLLAGVMFCNGSTEITAASWTPYFVQQSVLAGPAMGAVGMLCFGGAVALGRLSAATLVRHLGVQRLVTLGGVLAAIGLPLAALSMGSAWPVLWMACVGLGVAGIFPSVLANGGDRFPDGGPSLYALLATGALLGGVIGPMMVGVMADHWGLRTAMALMAVAPVALATLWWRLSQHSEPPPHST